MYALTHMNMEPPLESSAREHLDRALELDLEVAIDSTWDAFAPEMVRKMLRDLREARGRAMAPASAPAVLRVETRAPSDTVVPAQGGRLPLAATVSYPARVVMTIAPADAPGQLIWGDTAQVDRERVTSWNLRRMDGSIAGGRYELRVYARDSIGQVSAPIQHILGVGREPVDTQPHPRALQSSDFRPETLHLKRGSPASVAVGLALGAAAAVLPTALGAAELNAGRSGDGTAYPAAGAVSLGGIVGFLAGHRTRAMPENAGYNAELLQRDALRRREIAEHNRRLLDGAPIRVRVEGPGP